MESPVPADSNGATAGDVSTTASRTSTEDGVCTIDYGQLVPCRSVSTSVDSVERSERDSENAATDGVSGRPEDRR